ncbi:MAG: hypothetical protein MUF34_05750 [Polyangiaceae bacterium]|nr:hypothetical protein [Polyangiaceae bacterium]
MSVEPPPLRRAAFAFAQLALAALVALVAPACDADDDDAPVGYVIDFPSTAAAVASDSIKVYLFSPAENDCATLIQARRAGSLLPPARAETKAMAPCELLSGGGALTVDVGDAIVFGVAQRRGEDFLVGCTSRRLDASTSELTLSLTPFTNTVAVPTTACIALSDKCAGRCE